MLFKKALVGFMLAMSARVTAVFAGLEPPDQVHRDALEAEIKKWEDRRLQIHGEELAYLNSEYAAKSEYARVYKDWITALTEEKARTAKLKDENEAKRKELLAKGNRVTPEEVKQWKEERARIHELGEGNMKKLMEGFERYLKASRERGKEQERQLRKKIEEFKSMQSKATSLNAEITSMRRPPAEKLPWGMAAQPYPWEVSAKPGPPAVPPPPPPPPPPAAAPPAAHIPAPPPAPPPAAHIPAPPPAPPPQVTTAAVVAPINVLGPSVDTNKAHVVTIELVLPTTQPPTSSKTPTPVIVTRIHTSIEVATLPPVHVV